MKLHNVVRRSLVRLVALVALFVAGSNAIATDHGPSFQRVVPEGYKGKGHFWVGHISSRHLDAGRHNRRVTVFDPTGSAHVREGSPISVVYLHDGQHVFEAFEGRAFSGTWKMDHLGAKLAEEGSPLLLVAVDNGGVKRVDEFAPKPIPDGYGRVDAGQGGGAGRYLGFLHDEVVTAIDRHFHTVAEGRGRWLVWSSPRLVDSFYAVIWMTRCLSS